MYKMYNYSKRSTAKAAFLASVPVLMGYAAIGIAFGMLMTKASQPWYLAVLMSIFVYAGAMQYASVALLAANTGLAQIALITLIINSRHIVYGLSLLKKFSRVGLKKIYLIFALTDETYGIFTTVKTPDGADTGLFYTQVALYNHLYWGSWHPDRFYCY